MDICIHSMYCVDLYMADATEVGRPRGSGTLLGSNTRKSCKHFRGGGAWSHLEPFPGKAWKSCHAHGPEVEDEIFHDFPRSCYY